MERVYAIQASSVFRCCKSVRSFWSRGSDVVVAVSEEGFV